MTPVADSAARGRGSGAQPEARYLVQAVTRAARVIEAFQEADSLTLTEIAKKLDIPKPTAFRSVVTLEHVGLLRHLPDGGYCLGPLFISSARRVLGRGLGATARPHMEALHRATGHSVNLAILERGRVLYVDAIDSREGLRMVSPVGVHEPLHATAVGKAMLAELDAGDRDAVLGTQPLRAFTANTITSRTRLLVELEQVAIRGYAVDDSECVLGARCVGSAIRDVHKLVGGLSVSAPAASFGHEELDRVGILIHEAAQEIGDAMGIEPTIGYGNTNRTGSRRQDGRHGDPEEVQRDD